MLEILILDFESHSNIRVDSKITKYRQKQNQNIIIISNQKQHKNIQNQSFDNERLEFLGDAFISLIVAKYLFKLYPKKQEGYLTQLRAKIVSRDHLNKLGSSIGLEEFILYQKSANSYKSLVGNAFEALYGAIFLDLGFERAQISFEKFILIPHLDIDKIILENRDYLSLIHI